MITRRAFISGLVGATASICVATRIPLTVLPKSIRAASATKFITDAFNSYVKNRPSMYPQPVGEVYMVASPDLVNSFWEEAQDRGEISKTIKGISIKLLKGKHMKPWTVEVRQGHMVVV